MKILFAVINYKTSDLVIRLAQSLENSWLNCVPELRPQVFVNIYFNHKPTAGELEYLKDCISKFRIFIKLIPDGINSGYFGRLKDVRSAAFQEKYEIIAYSNADVVLDLNFCENLIRSKINLPNSCGMIAPSILSGATGEDLNPKYTSRIPFSKIKRLEFIYSSRILFNLYQFIGKTKSRIRGRGLGPNLKRTGIVKIYAPHGALMLFTSPEFFQMIPDHFCFMFGEEVHVAECAAKFKYDIFYAPSVVVYDDQHASIGKISNEQVRQWYLDSIIGMLKTHY